MPSLGRLYLLIMLDAGNTLSKEMQEAHNLPFPYNNQTFCRYEPIEKRVRHAKVLIVNDLLRYESDLSSCETECNATAEATNSSENFGNGVRNIAKNVSSRAAPKTLTVSLWKPPPGRKVSPGRVVLSVTLSDFDFTSRASRSHSRISQEPEVPFSLSCGAASSSAE